MSKRLIIVSVLIVILAIAGYFAWQRVFRVSETSVSSLDADVEIEASDLLNAYQANEDSANSRFLGKVVLVTGRVDGFDADSTTVSVYLKDPEAFAGVTCVFNPSAIDLSALQQGETLRIKGSCSGYLLDVVLNRCIVVNE